MKVEKSQPDFWKKLLIWRYLQKGLQISSGWLVGNTVFSEMALRIFLIFCMKLGDYKGRKVTVLDLWKKFLIWRYSRKGLQVNPKSDTDIFLLLTQGIKELSMKEITMHLSDKNYKS